MNVSKINTQAQAESNLSKTAKVAGTAAGIYGTATALSTVGMVKFAKSNPDVFTSAAEMLKPGYSTITDGGSITALIEGYKEFFAETTSELPQKLQNLVNLIPPSDKHFKEAVEQLDNLATISQGGKINWKGFAKSGLKRTAMFGAIAGIGYLAGKTIVDHIKAKKAE